MIAKLKTITDRIARADHVFWAGVMFFILVIIGIGFVSNVMYRQLMDAQSMPVSTLAISGYRQYSSDQEIQQALEKLSENESFFSLNVDQVKGLVEQIPWVAKASVRRKWPNSLQVHITEQVPVGYWNDQYLLSDSADIFRADQSRIEATLPRFYGDSDAAATLLDGYQALLPLLNSEGFVLNEIRLSGRQSWQIEINNNVILILGRVNTVMRNARVERFIKVYKHVIKPERAINYVDLRYDTGFAVNWKLQPGEKANNEQG